MELVKRQQIFICTLIFCAVLFFLFPLTTMAQTVSISDANLRAAVAAELGKGPGATITAEEVATLTHLVAVDADIREFDRDLNLQQDLKKLDLTTV